MKKWLCLMFVPVIILFAHDSFAESQKNTRQEHKSYKEIPGVTQEEITAVEALRAKTSGFVYGGTLSTEAFLLDDGSVGGFASLLYLRLSSLLGFTFTPHICNWDELTEKIGTKEIDFTSEFTATPERLHKYYMTDAIIQRTIKIFTNKHAEPLRTIAKDRPVRCAFVKESTIYPLVSASWDVPFEPVFIDGEPEVIDLFKDGKIDAYIDESVMEALFDAHDFIKAEDYYPLSYSPVSLATGNPELAPVQVIQKYLQHGGIYELTELYNQGKKDYLKHKLFMVLTEAEKEYILRHNSAETAITAGCETDNYPSSFYNAEEKETQGVAIDVLQQVTALTGLVFKVGNASDATWPEILEGLENGRYSIVTELMRTTQRKNRFLWAKEAYYTDNYALLSMADHPDLDVNQVLFSKVGLLKDAAYTDVFREWFPGSVNTVTYASSNNAFEALEKGEIDVLMATQNLLLHVTNYLEKPGFKTNIVFKYASDSYFGFNKDEKILCSIINRAQRYINTGEITERWKRKVFDYESKMLKDVFPYLLVFAALLLTGLCVVFFLFLKNRQISKNLEKLIAERTHELAVQTSTLTTIFDSIPDLVFCKDMHGYFTRCNRSFEEYFGRLEKDLLGKGDADGLGMPPEMAEEFRAADQKVVRERRTLTVEEYIPSINGITRRFETMKTPLIQDGAVIGIMGISRDITQRKAAEETLKLTLDNLHTCMYINEIETGKILFINDNMAKEFGGKDFTGQVCWEVLQDGFTEQCDFCPIPKLQKSGDEYHVWEEHNTVTGKHYRNTDSLITWHDGRLVHMQHSVDITDSIKLQRELEHASKAKGDFLSRMSHEIRTPLNAIIGMTDIAMHSDDLGKIKHCLDRVENASKHLLGVINDILDMSKIEADKFELSCTEFNFEKMLMNVTNVINFRVEEKHQDLVVNLNRDVPTCVIGDELRLSQVLTNLLTNAVKFTPEKGTIILGIEKVSETDDQVALRIEVADSGIGISEEQQKRLFTSFEQADGSISRKFGGTGLGLAISKRIVELMGGNVWIESELGHGSKFIFTVTVLRGKEATHTKLSAKIRKSAIRILAVDDSAETREYFAHVMAAHGLPCDVAADGFEALALMDNCGDRPYNIFFVDWQMPGMDGIELTRKIKVLTDDNSVVIMISVAAWCTIEKEALSAGVKQFIAKPLFPSTLIDAINGCLEPELPRNISCARGGSATQYSSFSKHTILIAEDVDINREIIAAVLEKTGVSIDFAENGRQVVSMFTEHPGKYSLILMDIHMPEMDGYEATRTIRALASAEAKSIPIVAMTANVFKEDIDSCLAAGMNDHTGKPIDQDDLFAKLDRYLLYK